MKKRPPPEPQNGDSKSQNKEGVGYGRPPKHSQFAPGKSGNPKGRPKGQPNFATIVRTLAQERISVTEGGRNRRVPRYDAFLRTLWAQAFKGNAKAAVLIQQLLRDVGLLRAEPDPIPSGISQDDHAIVRDYLEKFGLVLTDDASTEHHPKENTPKKPSADNKE